MSFYANPDPTYQPAMRIVTDITNADPALVTTSFAHDYIDGLIIRLWVPRNFGMFQVDKLFGEITVDTPTTFYIDLDTSDYDTFAIPTSPPYYHETAICIPIGNVNSLLTGYVHNVT